VVKKVIFVIGLLACILALIAACEPYGATTVAEVVLTSQTSSVSATTFYTPSADGDFLVTVYNSCGSGTGTSSETDIDYTDEFRTYTGTIETSAGNNGNARVLYPLHAASGQPIQYSTTYSGGTAACDTFVKLVKL
jgi:hypothetical protein